MRVSGGADRERWSRRLVKTVAKKVVQAYPVGLNPS